MNQSGGQADAERFAGGDGPPSAALVRACRALAEKFLGALHGRITDALQESLQALKDEGSIVQDPLVESLMLLDKGGKELGQVFLRRFSELHAAAVQPAAEGPAADLYPSSESGKEPTLSLVDDTQLEEWLAIDNLIAKIHERWSGELAGLRERYRQLLPELRINKYRLPIGPDKFCHAFHDALESAEADIRTRLYCYGLLDRTLSAEIGGFYSQVNHFLIGKGILPTLVTQEPAREAPRRRHAATAPPADGEQMPPAWGHATGQPAGHAAYGHPPTGPYDGSYGSQGSYGPGQAPYGSPPYGSSQGGSYGATPIREQMFAAIQHLIGVHGGQAGGQGGVPGPVEVAPVLIDTLSALQRDDTLVEHTGELIRGGLRHYVHGRFDGAGKGEKEISRLDDETIDVISMIFDYILDDRNLPDFIKALIGRLQIPVLKVALLDREFFSRKSHPARQLLNELAQAGAGWRDESEASRDRLYATMEAVVRRVIDEFESDISVFESLLAEFRAFLEDETQRFNAAQQKLLEDARRTERDEQMKSRVLVDIGSRMHGHELPEDIREFLLAPWRQYVIELTAAHGEEADARGRALALVDDLIWSLVPKRTPDERRRLTAMLPAMLQILREGLEQIGHPQAETDRLIHALQDYHFKSLKPPRAERQDAARGQAAEGIERMVEGLGEELGEGLDDIPALDWEKMASFDDVIEMRSPEGSGAFERMIAEMGLEPERDEGPRIDDEYTALVRGLEVGTWVELADQEEGVSRVRLAWRGDELTKFSFVNRQYKVVAERPLYVLADAFRRGAATVIENVALFDRAVDGVIAGIMKFARTSAP